MGRRIFFIELISVIFNVYFLYTTIYYLSNIFDEFSLLITSHIYCVSFYKTCQYAVIPLLEIFHIAIIKCYNLLSI